MEGAFDSSAVAWGYGVLRHAVVLACGVKQACLNEINQGNKSESFEIISEITNIETIAVGNSIREIAHLRKQYGQGRWRKLKGIAMIRLRSGRIRRAELHWYEAHGIGKKEVKRKRYLD